jgi:hypothetical protein
MFIQLDYSMSSRSSGPLLSLAAILEQEVLRVEGRHSHHWQRPVEALKAGTFKGKFDTKIVFDSERSAAAVIGLLPMS